MPETSESPRPLRVIGLEITHDWKSPYFGALPYVAAMRQLDKITDSFGHDSARDIVQRFLVNCATWKGPVARRIKAELKGMVK